MMPQQAKELEEVDMESDKGQEDQTNHETKEQRTVVGQGQESEQQSEQETQIANVANKASGVGQGQESEQQSEKKTQITNKESGVGQGQESEQQLEGKMSELQTQKDFHLTNQESGQTEDEHDRTKQSDKLDKGSEFGWVNASRDAFLTQLINKHEKSLSSSPERIQIGSDFVSVVSCYQLVADTVEYDFFAGTAMNVMNESGAMETGCLAMTYFGHVVTSSAKYCVVILSLDPVRHIIVQQSHHCRDSTW